MLHEQSDHRGDRKIGTSQFRVLTVGASCPRNCICDVIPSAARNPYFQQEIGVIGIPRHYARRVTAQGSVALIHR
jgi:hypothetical protein